ncbi:hypothetical protein Bbelb_103640 [Branchiostoma belcheri]|nr:hypothetical protein Bbelb_103640 [Branchiostoma belcheri]
MPLIRMTARAGPNKIPRTAGNNATQTPTYRFTCLHTCCCREVLELAGRRSACDQPVRHTLVYKYKQHSEQRRCIKSEISRFKVTPECGTLSIKHRHDQEVRPRPILNRKEQVFHEMNVDVFPIYLTAFAFLECTSGSDCMAAVAPELDCPRISRKQAKERRLLSQIRCHLVNRVVTTEVACSAFQQRKFLFRELPAQQGPLAALQMAASVWHLFGEISRDRYV